MTTKNSSITLLIVMFCNVSLRGMEPDEGTALPLFDVPVNEIQIVDKGPTWRIAFRPDEQHLIAVSKEDLGIRVWDWKKGEILCTLPCVWPYTGAVHALTISPDGNNLAYEKNNGKVVIQNLKTGQYSEKSKAPGSDNFNLLITKLFFNAQNTILIGDVQGYNVLLWDLKKDSDAEELKYEGGSLCCPAMSPDGRHLATKLQSSKSIILWDLITRNNCKLDWGDLTISDIVFSSYSRKMAVACGKAFKGSIIEIFNFADFLKEGDQAVEPEKTLITSLGCHGSLGNILGFSHGDKQLITTVPHDYGNVNRFQIWDVETGLCLRSLDGGDCLLLSPDGNALACIIYDGKGRGGQYFKKSRTIRIWDLAEFNDLRKSRDYAVTQEEREFLEYEKEYIADLRANLE